MYFTEYPIYHQNEVEVSLTKSLIEEQSSVFYTVSFIWNTLMLLDSPYTCFIESLMCKLYHTLNYILIHPFNNFLINVIVSYVVFLFILMDSYKSIVCVSWTVTLWVHNKVSLVSSCDRSIYTNTTSSPRNNHIQYLMQEIKNKWLGLLKQKRIGIPSFELDKRLQIYDHWNIWILAYYVY